MRIGEIVEEQIRLVSGQFLKGVPAGGDRDDARADRAGTANVQRRIADDPDTFHLDAGRMPGHHFAQGLPGHVVTVEMQRTETAEAEVFPEAEVGQLERDRHKDQRLRLHSLSKK